MKMQKHTHQYVRVKIGKNKRILYKCARIGCVHTCKPELIEGRISICNRCFNDFVFTKKHLELAKPHCDNCTISPKRANVSKIEEMLEKIL